MTAPLQSPAIERGAREPPKKGRRTEEVLRAFHEESDIVKAYDARLLGRLWPFVRPHARQLYLSFALLLVTAGMSLVRPLIMKSIIEFGMAKNAAKMMQGSYLLLGIVVVEQTMSFFQIYSMQLAGARSMADLRVHVFRFLHGLRLGFFDRQPIGRLVTRVTNDVDAISELFASGALNALGDLVRLVGIVVMMLLLDWRLSLIAFAALPPVAFFVNRIRHGSRKAYRDIRTKTARLNAFLNEQVSGIAVVQAFGREKAAAAEFDETNLAYRDANFRSIKFEASLDAAIEMVTMVCVALVLIAAGMRASTVGTIAAFIAYIKQFFEPISSLSQRYTLLQSAMTGAERVFELLETNEVDAPQPMRSASDEPRAPSRADVSFELDHVDFEYRKGVPVLHQVSLVARRGEKIAIVGATGSGKTTIASLLLRLYEATSGSVRVLGRDVKSYGRSELRQSFAVVPQDVYLFPGSIASNVAVGDAVPDRARVEEALEHVSGLDLFARREGGIDAKVEERGANFSAGERQLIAFARALYKNPPILILDEATASVDSDTESRLQRALAVLMEGRTALIIAHRLSTIRAVDRIIVLSKGRVVEEGRHEELLAKNGLYARLYRLKSAQDAEHLEAS